MVYLPTFIIRIANVGKYTLHGVSGIQIYTWSTGHPLCDGKNHLKWTTGSGPNPVWDGLCRTFGSQVGRRLFLAKQNVSNHFRFEESRWCFFFKIVYFQPDPWGNDPIWHLCIKWVETTTWELITWLSWICWLFYFSTMLNHHGKTHHLGEYVWNLFQASNTQI